MARDEDSRIEDVLTTIRPLGSGERSRWLDDHCPDPALRRVIEARLETRVATDLDEEVTVAAAPDQAAGAIGVGTRIGPCVLVRRIGEGGMGAVYAARQEGLGREVAVKLMKTGLATHQARQRFAYEARLLAGLHHPGIAQVFEYGTHESPGGIAVPYFVMELIPDGRPVTRWAAEADVDRDGAIELFAAICDAVHHAHQHGVVHRDLKPGNVLVDESGQPKVIDFGLARDVEDDAVTRSFRTETGALVGTLPYMSPEQLSGDAASVDTRSDVYSLGVIFYEMLCGRRPFDTRDLSLLQVVELVRDHPAPPPTSKDGPVDRDLARILAKALHKDPTRRYASADALAADVRRFLRGLPVEARPSTLTYNLRLFARRNRALVAAAAVVFLASIAAAIVSTSFALDARRARDRERERADAAERLLAGSNELSEWVMLDFIPRLRHLPGSTRLSEEAVARVLEHLESVSDAAADDRDHARTVGLAWLQVGMIQGAPSFPNLGRSDDALVSLGRAGDVFARLLEDEPGDVEAAINLEFARTVRAEILLDTGRTGDGLSRLADAQARLEDLLTSHPDHVRLMRVLINGHSVLSAVWRRRGDWEGAEAEALEAVTLHERIARLVDDPAPQRRALAGTLLELADIAAFAGHPAEALDRATKATENLELAYPGERDSPDARADFALAQRVLGDARLGLDDVDEARSAYEKSLALRDAVVAEHPDEVHGLEALAEILQRLADLRFGPAADAAGAVPLYARLLDVSRRIRALAPDNTEYRLRLQMAAMRYGDAAIVAGGLDEAAPIVEEVSDLAEGLAAENPDDPRFTRARAEALALRARLLIGRLTAPEVVDPGPLAARAIELFESAVDVYDDLEDRGIELPGAAEVRAAIVKQIRVTERLIEQLDAADDP